MRKRERGSGRFFGDGCAAVLLMLLFWPPAPAQQTETAGHAARSRKNMIASVHPIATEAGLQAFREGGNAVDAAVATALTLGVVDGFNSGIGGGCFVLIRSADGDIKAIDGREMAPAAAHRDMYLRDGKPDGRLSRNGPLASGVPGALAAYEQAVRENGLLHFRDLILSRFCRRCGRVCRRRKLPSPAERGFQYVATVRRFTPGAVAGKW